MTHLRNKEEINNWYKYSGKGVDQFLHERCYNYATTNTCAYGLACNYSHQPPVYPPRYLKYQGNQKFWSLYKPQQTTQNIQPNTTQYQTPNRYTITNKGINRNKTPAGKLGSFQIKDNFNKDQLLSQFVSSQDVRRNTHHTEQPQIDDQQFQSRFGYFQDTPVQQKHDFQYRTTTIKKTLNFDQHQTARKQQQQPDFKTKDAFELWNYIQNRDNYVYYWLINDRLNFVEVELVGNAMDKTKRPVMLLETRELRLAQKQDVVNKNTLIHYISDLIKNRQEHMIPHKLLDDKQPIINDNQSTTTTTTDQINDLTEQMKKASLDTIHEQTGDNDNNIEEPELKYNQQPNDIPAVDDQIDTHKLYICPEEHRDDIIVNNNINIQEVQNNELKLRLFKSADGHYRKCIYLEEYDNDNNKKEENEGDYISIYKIKTKERLTVSKELVVKFEPNKLDTEWNAMAAKIFKTMLREREHNYKPPEQKQPENINNREDKLAQILDAQMVLNETILKKQEEADERFIKILNIRNKDQKSRVTNLNKWDNNYIYTGDNNKYDGKKGRSLRQILKRWNIHKQLHGIKEHDYVPWWVNSILRGKAQNIYQRNAVKIGNDFKLLIRELTANTRLECYYEKIRKKIKHFRYKPGYTMRETVDYFIKLSKDLDKEREFANTFIPDVRLPQAFTFDELYDILYSSIKVLPKNFAVAVLQKELHENPKINNNVYLRTVYDLQRLIQHIISTEESHFPMEELRKTSRSNHRYKSKQDVRYRTKHRYRSQQKHRPYKSYKRRNKEQYLQNKFDKKRGKKYYKNRYNNSKYKKGKRFCKACKSETHNTRFCRNKEKRREYARRFRLCLWCLKPGHTLKQCKNRAEYNKNKSGNKNNKFNQKQNDQQQNKQQYNQQQYDEQQDSPTRYEYSDNTDDFLQSDEEETPPPPGALDDEKLEEEPTENKQQFIHEYDYSDSTTQEENESSESESYWGSEFSGKTKGGIYHQRIKELHKLEKETNRGKELFIKQTLEIVKTPNHDEAIPGGSSNIKLGIKLNNGNFCNVSTLNDSGSTLTVIRPSVIKKLLKKKLLGNKILNGKPFYVENGSSKDIKYEGTHIWLEFIKPNTDKTIKIKTYIMPHDNCRYDIILGIKDSYKLGYRMVIKNGKNIIYKHRGVTNHMEVLGNSKLADGYEYFNGHKIDLDKQQILLQQSKDDIEEKYSDDIKDENYYNYLQSEDDDMRDSTDSTDTDLPLYQES